MELTAAEAAARLGVKRSTLYAYVSRGLLHRHVAMDGRTSLFDSDEIDTFRSGRRRATEGELDTVISTALTRVRDGDLRIRGVGLVDLVDEDTDYETVVEILWAGEGAWDVSPELTTAVAAAQAALPTPTPAIDRLRVTVAVMSALDPMRFDLGPGAVRNAGASLLTAMVEGLPVSGKVPRAGRLADRLWPRLIGGRTNPDRRTALNAAMCLLVDHGLAASTLGARVAASTRADPYSVVSAGLGVVGGTLHGAASRSVHELFEAAASGGDAAAAVGDTYRRLGGNPGFGHTVYDHEDPRYGALMRRVSNAWRGDPKLATVHEVRDIVSQRTAAIANIDLALGALSWLSGMDPDAGEAIFAIARTAGWLAHALEEYEEAPLRFRPRARYVGERNPSRALGTAPVRNGST